MIAIKVQEMQSEEKLRGGYYTPYELTEYIAKYVVKNLNGKEKIILEPSVGDGNFYQAFQDLDIEFIMTGIELIEEEFLKANERVKNDERFYTINEDFYTFYHENRNSKYKAIVGNPPYIRYQLLTDLQRDYQSEMMKNNGLRTNRLINSWVAFTVASIEMLEEKGVFAFVLPTDLLQVTYAKELRAFLHAQLSEMNMINFNETVFEGIQQDVLLILGIKKNDETHTDHKLRIINIENKQDLLDLEIEDYPVESKESTERFFLNDKWSSVFLNKGNREYYSKLLKNNNVKNFNDYIKGQVGITTGNNKIFAVSDEIVKKYELEEYAIPLLGRSIEASGITYEIEDQEKNKQKDKNIWLLDFNNKEIKGKAKEYIKWVENKGENKGYKLGLRDNWYEIPSIWTPDAFLLRRIGSHPKIILNNLNATSTDTFHRLVFKKEVNQKLIIISLYSSLSLMSYELEGRVFAGGALEVLPGDLKNILLPKLDFWKNNNKIDKIFNELDRKMRNKVPIEEIVLWIDQKIIDLGYNDSSVLEQSYKVWRIVRNNRLSK